LSLFCVALNHHYLLYIFHANHIVVQVETIVSSFIVIYTNVRYLQNTKMTYFGDYT